jgi:hypothetical protein
MRAMSTSATTGASWIRARGLAGGRSGRTSAFAARSCSACTTIPDLRRSEREAKLAVRRKPRARECGLRRPALWAAIRYVSARPSAGRQQQPTARSATRTSCRGCVGVRRRTRPRHAVPRECMRGVRGVHGDAGGNRAARMRQARAMRRRRCGGRACATAASYSPSLLHACASWRGVRLHRSGVRPSAWLWAARRCPSSSVMR